MEGKQKKLKNLKSIAKQNKDSQQALPKKQLIHKKKNLYDIHSKLVVGKISQSFSPTQEHSMMMNHQKLNRFESHIFDHSELNPYFRENKDGEFIFEVQNEKGNSFQDKQFIKITNNNKESILNFDRMRCISLNSKPFQEVQQMDCEKDKFLIDLISNQISEYGSEKKAIYQGEESQLTHKIIRNKEKKVKKEDEQISQESNTISEQNLLFPFVVIQKLKFFQEPSEIKQFCIFSDCVVDLELFQENKEIYSNARLQPLSHFKETVQIIKLNNGDIIQVSQQTTVNPQVDYQFLINKIKSANSIEAYNWCLLLQHFLEKTQNQRDCIEKMMNVPEHELVQLKILFNQRRNYAEQQAKMHIKSIPRNKYAMYFQYHFDCESLSLRQTDVGYSRKILEIIGMTSNDAPAVFLRKGPIELISRKDKVQNMLLCAIQLADHPKIDLIDQIIGDTFIHTLDLIKLESKLEVKIINLTNNFDKLHNLNFSFGDDLFVEVLYDINQENLHKFNEVRKEKNVFEKFSIYDIIDGELEYLMEVENFLHKYYTSSVSSSQLSKKQLSHLSNRQKDYESSLQVIPKEQSKNSNCNLNHYFQHQINQQTCQPFDSYEIKQEHSLLTSSIFIEKANLINVLDGSYIKNLNEKVKH